MEQIDIRLSTYVFRITHTSRRGWSAGPELLEPDSGWYFYVQRLPLFKLPAATRLILSGG
jgi:hypothetical protein